MIIPNAKQAFIDIRKLSDYCLNPEHPRGKHKARVFQQTLGLIQSDAILLEKKIKKAIISEKCVWGLKDEYGQRLTVDFTWEKENNLVKIRTTWIIKESENFPRLTSCYVL